MIQNAIGSVKYKEYLYHAKTHKKKNTYLESHVVWCTCIYTNTNSLTYTHIHSQCVHTLLGLLEMKSVSANRLQIPQCTVIQVLDYFIEGIIIYKDDWEGGRDRQTDRDRQRRNFITWTTIAMPSVSFRDAYNWYWKEENVPLKWGFQRICENWWHLKGNC